VGPLLLSSDNPASFCASADSFFVRPSSPSVGVSSFGGTFLVPPKPSRPLSFVPFAFGVAGGRRDFFQWCFSVCRIVRSASFFADDVVSPCFSPDSGLPEYLSSYGYLIRYFPTCYLMWHQYSTD
jgi:hypothetical protein